MIAAGRKSVLIWYIFKNLEFCGIFLSTLLEYRAILLTLFKSYALHQFYGSRIYNCLNTLSLVMDIP